MFCARPDATPPRSGQEFIDQPIRIIVEPGDATRVVRIVGELDAASRDSVTRACTEGQTSAVIVDLSALSFLDCGGYRAFVAARTILQQHGRTLVLVGAAGEPRRLLDLVDQIDQKNPRSDDDPSSRDIRHPSIHTSEGSHT